MGRVEAGALTLVLSRGVASVQTPEGEDDVLDNGGMTTALPGDGALLQNQANAMLRNDGDGALLLLARTVTAVGNPAAPPAATP